MRLFFTLILLIVSLSIRAQTTEYQLQTITGEEINLKDLNGKVVLYNIWFTACPPCIKEIPMLNKLQQEYNGRVEFISFTISNRRSVEKFLVKNPFSFKIIPSTRKKIIDMNLGQYFPTNTLLNRKGEVIHQVVGSPRDSVGLAIVYDEWRAKIDFALKDN